MVKEKKILGSIIISPLLKAKNSIDQILAIEKTDVVRDAAIQRFEYTFELAWKTMKRILKHQGLDVNSPREAFRLAAKNNLIKDPQPWFEFTEKRNLSSHTYNVATADEIYQIIPGFVSELEVFLKNINDL